jgi:two-component system, sensor histidine kinase and response regulator
MSQAFDPDALARCTDNDPQLAREVCDIFVEQSQTMLDTLRVAVQDGDSESLRSVAHSLKGAAGCVGAEQVRALALELEIMGKTAATDEAKSKFAELESAIHEVNGAIAAFLDANKSGEDRAIHGSEGKLRQK